MDKLMNNMQIFIIAIMVSIPVASFSENTNSQDYEISEELRAELFRKANCAEGKRVITEMLRQEVECFADTDCRYFDYGYPWQPAPCVKAIVSVYEEDKNIQELELIERYNQRCIEGDKDEMAKYKEMQKLTEETSCDFGKLICLQGKCRKKNYLSIIERPDEKGNYR